MSLGLLGRVAIGIGGRRQHQPQRILVAAAADPAHAMTELLRAVADEIRRSIGKHLQAVRPTRSSAAAIERQDQLGIDRRPGHDLAMLARIGQHGFDKLAMRFGRA